MPLNPHHISLATKSCNPIRRDAPNHYVSTIHIDILHGDDQEKIGEATVYEVRMDQIINDDEWSLFDIFDGHSNDLGNLYEELFADDELIPAVEDELCDYEQYRADQVDYPETGISRSGLGRHPGAGDCRAVWRARHCGIETMAHESRCSRQSGRRVGTAPVVRNSTESHRQKTR